MQLDSGGLAKGLFADVLAAGLARHASFAVDCGGDLAIGGSAGVERPVDVAEPVRRQHARAPVALRAAGVATSGIGRRSWLDAEGRPAHHLLDPSTSRPAFTGLVQATAVAPSALQAEVRAKAALLAGPREAARWLPDGGVLVLDDGSHRVLEPAPKMSPPRNSSATGGAPQTPCPRRPEPGANRGGSTRAAIASPTITEAVSSSIATTPAERPASHQT